MQVFIDVFIPGVVGLNRCVSLLFIGVIKGVFVLWVCGGQRSSIAKVKLDDEETDEMFTRRPRPKTTAITL